MAYYNPTKVRNGVFKVKDSDFKNKNIILIHGKDGDGDFGKNSDHMKAFYEHCENAGMFENYNVWALTYNSWWVPFENSGKWLAEEMKKLEQFNFNDAIVIGYSMGGLIGRAMIASAFNFKYLITIDTPHLGPVTGFNVAMGLAGGLVPAGIASLGWGSPSHVYIDNNKLDIAKRANDYAFYGIDFRNNDKEQYHGDDSVVPVSSQLGYDYKEQIRWRYLYKKENTKDNEAKNFAPHTAAALPENCMEAINLLKKIVKDGTMPALALGENTASSPSEHYNLETDKLPYNMSELAAWYFFSNDNLPYVKLRAIIENKSTKPLPIDQKTLVGSNIGRFYAADEKRDKFILTPKAKRILQMRRNHSISELLPETIQLFVTYINLDLPLYYIPLPLSDNNVYPTEHIWNLNALDLKATSKIDGENINVYITGSIVNNSNISMELHAYSIITKIDTSPNFGGLNTDGDVFTWVAEDRFLKIVPNGNTPFKLSCGFHTKNKPSIINFKLGSNFMPALDEDIIIS